MTPTSSLLPSLELRLLRYVVAVAEELHFTRASARLHLSTPSLSRQIRQLEQLLGYPLFVRSTRAIALTPAGAAFVAEARRALTHAQRAVEAGAAATAGESAVIRVGYTPLLCAALLAQIRRAFAQCADNMPLRLQSAYSIHQIDQIQSGRLDVGLVVLPVAPSELRTDRMFRSRLVAAVPDDSGLARNAVIGPEDIAGQPIIWFGKLTNPQLYQHFVDCCRQAGFTPNIAHEVSTVMEMLDSVAAGVGITFVEDKVASRFRPEGIVFRELAAPEFVLEIGVAYRDEDCSGSLLALLEVLRQLSDCHRSDGASAVKPISG